MIALSNCVSFASARHRPATKWFGCSVLWGRTHEWTGWKSDWAGNIIWAVLGTPASRHRPRGMSVWMGWTIFRQSSEVRAPERLPLNRTPRAALPVTLLFISFMAMAILLLHEHSGQAASESLSAVVVRNFVPNGHKDPHDGGLW